MPSAGTLRRLRGLIKRYERYAKDAEKEMLELHLSDEVRLGRIMRFSEYDGFLRGLKAADEYLAGDDEALQAHYEAIEGIDYTEIFRNPPEVDGEALPN